MQLWTIGVSIVFVFIHKSVYAVPDHCDQQDAMVRLRNHIGAFLKANAPEIPPKSQYQRAFFWFSDLVEVLEMVNTFTLNGGAYIYLHNLTEFRWDASEYCDITKYDVKESTELHAYVWRPVLESRSMISVYSPNEVNDFLTLDSEGDVMLATMALKMSAVTMRCVFDMRMYPFDYQVCIMSYYWYYGMMYMKPTFNCFNYQNWNTNPAWLILNCDIENVEFIPGLGIYSMNLRVLLQRRPRRPIVNVLLPTMILANVNPVIFVLPARSPAKTTVGMSFMLAIFVYLSGLSNEMPPSPDTPYFMIYIMSVLVLNCLAIGTSSAIQRIMDDKKLNRTNNLCCLGMTLLEVLLVASYALVVSNPPSFLCNSTICTWNGLELNKTVQLPM